MLSTDTIEHILRTLPGKTVAVLGDLFLDRYLDIDAALDEPSVETGLTAYQVVGVRGYRQHALERTFGVGQVVWVEVGAVSKARCPAQRPCPKIGRQVGQRYGEAGRSSRDFRHSSSNRQNRQRSVSAGK